MHKTKKITAMLAFFMVFSFGMVLSLTACGKSGLNAVGKWSMKLDLSDAMKEEMGSEFAAFDTPYAFTLYLELNKDGSYKIGLDEKEAEKDMATYMDALSDFFTEHIYSAMEAQGVDRETAQTALEAQVGMSLKDYALQAIRESIDIDDVISSIEHQGIYKINDGKLFLGGDKVDENIYDLITIDGDKMTLNAAADASASAFLNGTIPGLSFPFELTRVK